MPHTRRGRCGENCGRYNLSLQLRYVCNKPTKQSVLEECFSLVANDDDRYGKLADEFREGLSSSSSLNRRLIINK